MIRSLLGGNDSDEADQEQVDPMPIDAVIGVLDALRHDLDGVELTNEEHKRLLAELEAVDALVPGRDDGMEMLEAYPVDERVDVWLEWLTDRLDAATIGGSGLHADLERQVIAFEDLVDDILPFDTSTEAIGESKYKFKELDVEQFKGHDSIAEGVTYERLADALTEFRDDHREYLTTDGELVDDVAGEASDQQPVDSAADTEIDSDEAADSAETAVDQLILNPDAFTEGSVGEGQWEETPQINEHQAGEIADTAREEWDGEGDPTEEFLRTAARGHVPGVSEAGTVEAQPSEYAVVDQYNKRHDPVNERRTDPDAFEYVEPHPSSDDEDDLAGSQTDSLEEPTEHQSNGDESADSPESITDELSDQTDNTGIRDRLTGLLGSTTEDADSVDTVEPQDIEPAGGDTDDNEDEAGLEAWKIDLLERDPDPEYVDEYTIGRFIEAEYLQTDGQDPDIKTYAGPHARRMMEIHDDRPRDPLWIGHEYKAGTEVPIEQGTLFTHQFIVGKTGSGKSNMMGNQFRELMEAGYGGLFADPNGDDSKRLMRILPKDRLEDVIWIEPGGAHEYATGINFLEVGLDEDDPHFDTALEALVDDLVKMIGAGDYWGPRMDRIARNMIRAMNKSEHDFNLLDMYYILGDEGSRQVFSEIIQDQGLDFIALYNREIAEKDQDDFDAVLGRLQDWVENTIARQLVAFRDSPINIAEAVENNKIIIVRMGQESKDLKRMLSMAILRRVWAAIRARSDQDAGDRKPFFLYMDEFDNIVRSEDETISDMLSEARKYRLSVTAATQHPSQIPDETLEDIYGNTDTRLAFKLGHIDHARSVAPALGLDDPHTLVREADYNFWTMLTSGRGETTEAFKAYSLPPYPPLRSTDDAENHIQQSLREHGVAMTDEDIKDALKFKFGAGELERRGVAGDDASTDSIHKKAKTKLRDTLLEAIYVTQIKQDAKGQFVPMEAVEAEWERRAGDLGYQSKPAQVLERLPDELVPQANRSDGLYVRLTPEALDKAGLTQDTGANASAGGKMHRWVLSRAFEAFTVWDCFVDLPDQGDDGELPDGLADLPIDPVERVKQSDDPRAFTNAVEDLKDEYPELHELTGGRNIAIEAETTTIENPMQTLTNLRKAVNESKFCVFAVKPPTENGRAPTDAPFDYWVQRGEQVVYRTERNGTHVKSIDYDEVTCVRETTAAGHRRFYNGDPLILEDETIPLRPGSDEDLAWWERDGELIAETETGDTVAHFNTVHSFEDVEKGDFPAYASNDGGTITVYEGGETHEYEDTDMMEREWSYIHEPFIPALEFDDTLPTPDDFAFVVFPLADSGVDEPMVIRGDEQYPLLPEGRSMPGGEIEAGEVDAEAADPNQQDEDVDDDHESSGDGEPTDSETDTPVSEAEGANVGDETPAPEPDITPIGELEPGGAAAMTGEVQSYGEIQQVAPASGTEPVAMRSVTLKDETGTIRAQLWDRHADYDIREGKEVLIAGASVEREIRDGVMEFVVNVGSSDTIVAAPETIASSTTATGETDALSDDSVAVTDGAASDLNQPAAGERDEVEADSSTTNEETEADSTAENRLFDY